MRGHPCTVLEQLGGDGEGTGEFFLALCDGGMDLSQDVALAYLLARQSIPDVLAVHVSTQAGLSKTGGNGVE